VLHDQAMPLPVSSTPPSALACFETTPSAKLRCRILRGGCEETKEVARITCPRVEEASNYIVRRLRKLRVARILGGDWIRIQGGVSRAQSS
jgi:hypothetical protein